MYSAVVGYDRSLASENQTLGTHTVPKKSSRESRTPSFHTSRQQGVLACWALDVSGVRKSSVHRETKEGSRLRTMSPVDLCMVRDCAPSGSTGAKV